MNDKVKKSAKGDSNIQNIHVIGAWDNGWRHRCSSCYAGI